jgi:hypothetical protein
MVTIDLTQEESIPRYTQLEVSLLSKPLSCLTIGLDIGLLHQQNVNWFGSYNSMTQLFRTATPILPEAPRRSRTG